MSLKKITHDAATILLSKSGQARGKVLGLLYLTIYEYNKVLIINIIWVVISYRVEVFT